MKKKFLLFILLLASVQMFSENKNNAYFGVLTRCGYAFNYDAFNYGVSVIYKFDGLFGVTAGFDGYYIPNKFLIGDKQHLSNYHKFPLWDCRFGFILTKYLTFGGLLGKWTLENPNEIYMSRDMWGIDNERNRMLYGGFVTFVLPVKDYLGFNIDLALTNKTGFNICAGVNFTIKTSN